MDITAFFVAWIVTSIIFLVLGIVLWVIGIKNQSIAMTIIGAFLCLNFLGVIIAVVQVSHWERGPRNNSTWKPPEENKDQNQDTKLPENKKK